jgi:hypothetical protein
LITRELTRTFRSSQDARERERSSGRQDSFDRSPHFQRGDMVGLRIAQQAECGTSDCNTTNGSYKVDGEGSRRRGSFGIKALKSVPHGLKTGGATGMLYTKATTHEIEVRGRRAPGSGSVISYLASTSRSSMLCFTESKCLGYFEGRDSGRPFPQPLPRV